MAANRATECYHREGNVTVTREANDGAAWQRTAFVNKGQVEGFSRAMSNETNKQGMRDIY
ncbi:hypothetical protein B9L19_09000 [Geobacillus thermocatenulatus]|uniref:Uncharacterized protein n=1 Tax=Geobacillus thermocatenulatus TaxID=33938 RepID=A0AA91QJK1_9BACL|nr:hypothetical protein B9L19_09000 [Geobacillus thermocatenulatus]